MVEHGIELENEENIHILEDGTEKRVGTQHWTIDENIDTVNKRIVTEVKKILSEVRGSRLKTVQSEKEKKEQKIVTFL